MKEMARSMDKYAGSVRTMKLQAWMATGLVIVLAGCSSAAGGDTTQVNAASAFVTLKWPPIGTATRSPCHVNATPTAPTRLWT